MEKSIQSSNTQQVMSAHYFNEHLLFNEFVDIYVRPRPCIISFGQAPTDTIEITIGDLHGNAIKLLYHLIKFQIATNLEEEDYEDMVEIYNKKAKDLNRGDLEIFKMYLAKMKFNPAFKLRLIGDELADRGSNDYFTLLILNQLSLHKVPLEILISNHGYDFLTAYEKVIKERHDNQEKTSPEFKSYYENEKDRPFIKSMLNLNFIIQKGLILIDEVIHIVEFAYKPFIKALSFTMAADGSSLTLYTHAPVGLETIKNLGVNMKCSATEFANEINKFNEQFTRNIIQKNNLSTIPRNLDYNSADVKAAAILDLMFNRDYKKLERNESYNGFQIIYVHGHDSSKIPPKDHIFNLDNDLGKKTSKSKGLLTLICSDRMRIKNTLTDTNPDINSIELIAEILTDDKGPALAL